VFVSATRQEKQLVNICLDRNTLILMIDKRSPRRATMQKAEKKFKLSSLES
jgi:hypothetical protein